MRSSTIPLRHERVAERGGCAGTLDVELAHVREVEEAGALADGPVLLEDPRVLERHEPPAELDELRAERAVALDDRRDVPGSGALGHARDAESGDAASASAARATRSRSVSNVRSVAASANGTQRTSSNSWS